MLFSGINLDDYTKALLQISYGEVTNQLDLNEIMVLKPVFGKSLQFSEKSKRLIVLLEFQHNDDTPHAP
ncbi:protein of unknown function [Brevefilum fermentans]|jgi:hypothetical protein|uniref:Uncharacterized protein n=1 Tax=Candidatus Brevifilum fermentans TaxID=1986204 RepID=A0A1Y6K702_9CHLR|nr:protein of unknown function [Brevefilum fermentans]